MNDNVVVPSGSSQHNDLLNSIRTVFDRAYYFSQYPDVEDLGVDPLEHFLAKGRYEGRSGHPLFDPRFYLAQLRGNSGVADPLGHYLESGHALGLAPHPLFDPAYYATLVGPGLVGPPLLHYLEQGWSRGLSPHPLFDPEYYVVSGGIELGGRDPLSHYLMQTEFNFAPHYLFSDAVYVAELHKAIGAQAPDAHRGGPPLLHYVVRGHRHEPKTHPLFDPAFYRANVQRALSSRPDEAVEASLRSATDLLRHYLEVGVPLEVSPSGFFDLPFYRRNVGDAVVGDPIRHYLMPEGFARYSPHPGIDLDYYSSRAGFLPADVPSVLHLLSTPQAERISPHPAFDSVRYKRMYDDIGKAGVCPVLHFLEHGMREDRSPNEWFSAEYVYHQHPQHDFRNESAVHYYFAGDMPKRTRLVFVSHDAGLTGAPGTVLRLTEDFASHDNVECFAVVARQGARVPDFQRTAHTIVLNTAFYTASPAQLRGVVRQLLALTEGNTPVAAVVNSAESRAIAPELARAGIPVITLVHEAADLYPQGAFDTIVESSKSIVFGSQYVLERARNVTMLPEHLAVVRGQGLQQDYVGTMNRGVARRLVLAELELEDDTFLVLGCGSVDYRKGADLFVAAALDFLRSQGSADSQACFIWVGQGDGSTFQSFISNAIRGEGRGVDIRFLGSRTDVEPYFMAADAFLMTSRVDPFPCVCQEAMASGLPIIAFAEGGGTIEMIGEEAGFCVPLGDTAAMSARLGQLAANPSLRAQLGTRGREIVRQQWRPEDYTSFMAAKLAEIAGIDVDHFGRRTDHVQHSRTSAYFLFDNWVSSAFTAHVEMLVDGLNGLGIDAEIVITRGRFTADDGAHQLPSARHRFLEPSAAGFSDGRWRTSAEEVWRELQSFARKMQPCVLFVADDLLATALAPLLPSAVAVVPLMVEADPVTVDAFYQAGPQVDAVVALSDKGARDLVALNPGLAAKIAIVSPGATVPEGLSEEHRDIVLVRADLTDKSTGALLLNLQRRLRAQAIGHRLVIAADRGPAGQSRRSLAASLGVKADDLLIGMGAEQIRLLERTDFVVLLSSDRSAMALVPEALAHGATVVGLGQSPSMTHMLGNGNHGYCVRTGIEGVADLIVHLSNNPEEHAAHRAQAMDWTRRKGGSLGEEIQSYRALIEELTETLRSHGSTRPLHLPHLAVRRFVWPAAMRGAALSDVKLPPV